MNAITTLIDQVVKQRQIIEQSYPRIIMTHVITRCPNCGQILDTTNTSCAICPQCGAKNCGE